MSAKYMMKIPSRINILGNPTDGNEGDFATISAAINVYAGGTIESDNEYVYRWIDRKNPNKQISEFRTSKAHNLDFDDNDPLKLFKGTLRYLMREYLEARRKITKSGMRIALWTDVPRQSGLGGSSLPILMILEGVKKLYGFDDDEFNRYAISEIAQRIEEKELGITCGFSDRYVPNFGGIAYLDYRGKLRHEPIGSEPYVTYERLDSFVPELHFIIVSTGVQHDSGDVHGVMRGEYLRDVERVETQGAKPSLVLKKFKLIGDTAWKGKIALLSSNLAEFGRLMNENHRLIDEIMLECGFTEGAGKANNLFIKAALDAGALGAKLTGAGGGGSVQIFAGKADEGRVIKVLKKKISDGNFPKAKLMRVSIDKAGLTIKSK
jgi:galactokinase/mevalonate kinase-like predicted kinase